MGQPVVHFEIGSQDGERIRNFYSSLFGWNIDTNNPMNYGFVKTGGEGGIDGGVAQFKEGDNFPSYLTVYVQVDDLQSYLDKVESMGGKTVVPPTEIAPEVGSFAMFSDPDGNVMGLFKNP